MGFSLFSCDPDDQLKLNFYKLVSSCIIWVKQIRPSLKGKAPQKTTLRLFASLYFTYWFCHALLNVHIRIFQMLVTEELFPPVFTSIFCSPRDKSPRVDIRIHISYLVYLRESLKLFVFLSNYRVGKWGMFCGCSSLCQEWLRRGTSGVSTCSKRRTRHFTRTGACFLSKCSTMETAPHRPHATIFYQRPLVKICETAL